jgi:hypothetical protein
MNYAKKSLIYFIIHTSVGVIALLFALFSHMPEGYKSSVLFGMACGFLCSGIPGIILSIRMINNPKKALAVEIAKNEERTQFIRTKTNSSIYTVSLYAECIVTLISSLLGFKEISLIFSILLIAQLFLFIGFANYYGKKY